MKKVFLLIPMLLLLITVRAFALDYGEWLEQYASVPSATENITVEASAFTAAEGVEYLPDGTVSTSGEGYIEFTVSVPETALYNITLSYFPGVGTGGDIHRSLSVNGVIPYDEAASLVFSRMWNDADRSYKQAEGNQPFPSQTETPEWMEKTLSDADGYHISPLQFQLSAGENTLRLTGISEGMILSSMTLTPVQTLLSYDAYLALHTGDSRITDAFIKVQAEDAALKSSPSFYPVNDRTSPLTEPYDPTWIILNCIGDTAWNEPGEWIAWDVDAPEDGLYRIFFRFRQADLRGLYACRTLRINGVIPFAEAADLRFRYGSSFQYSALKGESGDYWFYLKKGTNRLSLEVSLGAMGEVLRAMESETEKLNRLYREIIAITGTSPDIYTDYRLFTRIPHLQRTLTELHASLSETLNRLTALTGSGNERTAGITRLLALMTRMADDEEQVVRNLSAYKECVTAIGKSVLDLQDQPLRIDYFVVCGENEPEGRAEGNFLEKAKHTLLAFFGSFYNDYTVAASKTEDDEIKTVSVWLSTGRDQFEVIRRLINESFEGEYGVKVNLRLISADVLLPSTFTGVGPDVAIQIGNTAPVNFAFRDAALDLSQFDDYEEIASRFLPAAMESFRYNDGVFALPDQMSYPVMFVRTDILEALGLKVPDTWEELIALIPELQRNNMEIYLDTYTPTTLGAALSMGNSVAINNIFLARLYQTGGKIYTDTGDWCLLSDETASAAFKWWTQFYTRHGFPREIDFVTRFRLGETPIGVADLHTYNTLAVSAPEIRGAWAIYQMPGTVRENGSITRDIPCVTGASMIVRNAVERRQNADAAWAFLKWWTCADTQIAYAREMEAVLGQAGRYLVANLDAYQQIAWEPDTRKILNNVLTTLHGIPQVPGGYITGRYLNNAFVTVVTNYVNPGDTLYDAVEEINREITLKREEFKLPVYDVTEGSEEE